MNNKNDLRSQLPDMISALQSGKQVEFETHGFSMIPLLHDGGDRVVLRQVDSHLNVGDVALCKTSDERYVLHRVVAFEPEGYIFQGDNCVTTERCLSHADVVGVACAFIRKGKVILCTDKKYLFYVRHRRIFVAVWRAFWRVADFFVKVFRK